MKKAYVLFLFLFCAFCVQPQTNTDLIPYPASMVVGKGSFVFPSKVKLQTMNSHKPTKEISYLQSLLAEYGITLSETEGQKTIELIISGEKLNPEGYSLDITSDKIRISASEPAGFFYAIQTLNQLISLNTTSGKHIVLPALKITDHPAFPWRGSMIDVSRHFFNIEYLKKHIDRLSFYKMNKFHLHLTDDQGWRIEIKKYPKLTEQGAFRTYNNHDSVCMKLSKDNPDFGLDSRFIKKINNTPIYGGYYTQDELRDLVAYAAERHVEIIPEIDMPGHMMAAISVYPQLTDGRIGWGKLFSTPICPCKDEVYTFIEDVIDEVVSIFPSQYIHIGADEVDKTTWKESELCKQLMKKEGISDVEKLQSYFVHRLKDIIKSKGKKIIAWDEVLDGGVDSDVCVMYWRGWVPGSPSKSVSNGNAVIMSPTNPVYFDTYPDKSSLYNVYNMRVVYDDVPKEKAHLIQGAQANMWAEKIASENRADFMLFPRMTALAERVWTNKDLFEDYSKRLLSHFPILDKMGVGYRMPDLCGIALESVFVGETMLDVKNPLAGKFIHYTTDGSIPDARSPILKNPLKINEPTTIKLRLLGNNTAKGDIYIVNYKASDFAKPIQLGKQFKSGLNCDFYDQPIDRTSKISGKADKQYTVNKIQVPSEIQSPQFGLRYSGFIEVPETGIYSFYLTCDDAGMLYIADRLVIDNEGPHSPIEKSGQVALEKGLHPFRLDFVEGGGGYTLLLQYATDGCLVKDIPDNWLKN